jgi:hypothetical protein
MHATWYNTLSNLNMAMALQNVCGSPKSRTRYNYLKCDKFLKEGIFINE